VKKENQLEAMRAKLGGLSDGKKRKSIFDVDGAPVEVPVITEPVKAKAEVPIIENKITPKAGAEKAKKAVGKSGYHEVLVPFPIELLDMIQADAKAISRNGLQKSARITANSIIRSVLSIYEDIAVDFGAVDSEESLNIAVKSAIKARMRG
jgi:hypothetical protein